MNGKIIRYHLIIVVLIMLLLTGCGSLPLTASSTVTPVLVPTPAPGEAWNYVFLGDSSSWAFPKFYAKYIEEDLGVKVKLINWTHGGMNSAQVLDVLRTNQEERHDVSQAQVVTFYGNPLHLISAGNEGSGEVLDCSPQTVASYKAELGAIADEILSLRKGQPTIIRAYTRFMPSYRQWKETGRFDENRRCIAALDAAILEMGKEHSILVADVGLALNGPNHDQDPAEMGYLYDGMHENDKGGQLVADVFRKLGYEGIVPLFVSEATPATSVTLVTASTPAQTMQPSLTVTIKGDQCVLDGPMSVPYGEFVIQMIVQQDNISENGYALVTLEAGKTIEDLKAWPSASPPPWDNRLAGEHSLRIGTSTRVINFTSNAAWHSGEPIYLVCFHTDPETRILTKSGAFGPIEVNE